MAAVSGENSPNFSFDRPEPGGLPYKRDDEHRRLALGCKLLILVSLWDGKSLTLASSGIA